MIDQNTDFFAYVDNFAKIEGIESIKVFGNENDPSVGYTIAIPTYKRTEYLKEAIDSALNQDCNFSYNVMVVDNNPERGDDTEKMMESYKSTKNLSYYKNTENLGMAGNWNRLFQLAKTKWVVMLHDDDMLYPYFLKVCDDIINDNSDIDILKPKESRIFDPIYKEHKRKVKHIIGLDFYYGNSYGTPSGMVLRRESVLASGGYNQDYYPGLDYCFHARFSSMYNFYYCDEQLMFYRIAVNESQNVNVQKKWIVDASYLIRQILSINHIPNLIINYFVSRRSLNCYNQLQREWNSNFDFSLNEIGLSRVTEPMGILSHCYIRLCLLIARLEDKIAKTLGEK